MKLILFTFLLLGSWLLAEENFILRPNIKFYAKGQEGGRLKEFEKFKDSELTKAYQIVFEGKSFTELKIYYVDYPSLKDKDIVPSKVNLCKTFTAKDPELQQMKSFFATAFPEQTRRFLETKTINGMLFQFSGDEEVNVLVPYDIDEPEFRLVLVNRAQEKSITGIDMAQKGAMSKHIPPRLFFDLWDIANGKNSLPKKPEMETQREPSD